MVRFNIIGHGFIDVSDPSGISFKLQNQHFRFADISLGRTTEFSVPSTESNRELLGFGDNPAESGDMMRKIFPAQMVYDGGAVNGTIAVTGYSSEAFTCVFTIGNAELIDAVQNRKLSECVSSWDKGVPWSGTGTPMDANDPSLVGVNEAIIKYDNGTLFSSNWQLVPSVRIKAYIEDILTNIGITHNIDINPDLWMVAGSMKGGGKDTVTISSTAANAVTISTQVENYLDIADIDIEWATILLFDGGAVGGGSFPAKAIEAQRDIQITFPMNMPDCYCVKWSRKLSRYTQLGAGSNLSGQTITLHKGDKVFFADYPVRWNGYQDTFHPYSFTVDVVSDGTLTLGETWFMRNNHPDMTVFEFLRSVALATGTELTVDGVTGVTMGAGQYGDSTDFKALERVVTVDSVTRRVESWGNGTRKASVVFDSEDYVTDRIRSTYDIDNEQQQENTEHVSKFSEGNVGDDGVVIEDVDVSSSPAKFTAKRWTLAMATADSEWLQRIDTPDPVGYIDIADNSTCTQVRCAMQLVELFALQSSTVLLWRGCAYIWTDASWSDGIISITLQRVSGIRIDTTPTPPVELVSIKAQFNQGGAVVVGTDNLDTLKQYLTVEATYSDSSTRVLDSNEYTLSGTLAYPSATITAECQGVTDTFAVAVAYDAQVEYLESTGTQYIDTGIIIDESDSIVADVQFIDNGSTTYNTIGESIDNDNSSYIFLRIRYGSWYVRFGSSSTSKSSNRANYNRHLLELKKNSFSVDNYLISQPNYVSMPQVSYILGRIGSSTSFFGRLFEFEIINQSDSNRIDLIPVRCGTTGYMYDRVSGTLFGNDGTGDFVLGADV